MEDEKMFYNAVALELEGNPLAVRNAKKKCGDLFGGWKTTYELLIAEGRSPPNPELAWRKLQSAGVRLILFGDDDYPPLLRQIHNPPLGLYVRGALPTQACFAIVGTRRATPDGKASARKFARELAGAGFIIASGLAFGIDAAAHEGCLEARGKTVAVLAGGLHEFYPQENEWLAKKILERGGAVISEYPLGEPSYQDRFLERNRIVSGLSQGTLVIECPKRSGALATACFAIQQNRDLFVMPGSILHQNFFGSHQLIRQGAELVTAPREILEAYELLDEDKNSPEHLDASNEEKQVLLALRDSPEPLDVDKIITITKLEPRVANQALTFLLMKNFIKETGDGYIIE